MENTTTDETIEILSNKRLMNGIRKRIEDIRNNKFITFEDFKKKHKLY